MLPLLACLAILGHRSSSPTLLQDTDTAVLLRALDARHDPLSWFRTDWPLENRFYRPVSTLGFEMDRVVYRDAAYGYGLTNVLLACACTFLLFWLLRESTRSPWLAGTSSVVFGLWTCDSAALTVATPAMWWLAAVALLGILRGGMAKIGVCVGAAATLVFLSSLLAPVAAFDHRVLTWLPGRTASTMTVFALAAMAAHARYERLTARSQPRSPTPMDVPSTKGTETVTEAQRKSAWVWITLAGLSSALALLSYEQAVMLPAALAGLSVMTLLGGKSPSWRPHALYWGLLVGYLAVRWSVIPPGVSGYQQQQFRDGPGVLLVLMDYAFPAWNWLATCGVALSVGIEVLLTDVPWRYLSLSAANVGAWATVRRHTLWPIAIGSMVLALITFLPMAWLQPFGHYHYWPSAFRAVFVCSLAAVAAKALVSAVSLPSVQAPARPRPAPGSLPRP